MKVCIFSDGHFIDFVITTRIKMRIKNIYICCMYHSSFGVVKKIFASGDKKFIKMIIIIIILLSRDKFIALRS